jgi:hypothetical protein
LLAIGVPPGASGHRFRRIQKSAGGETVSSAPKIRFGLWFDFRNPPQWRRSYEDIYAETIEQVV